MKFEMKPQFVDAMQWTGDPETLETLLRWIMSNRVSESREAPPVIEYIRRWGPREEQTGQPKAEISGHRWHVHLEAGDWVVKDGSHITSLSDERFKAIYKQVRNKR